MGARTRPPVLPSPRTLFYAAAIRGGPSAQPFSLTSPVTFWSLISGPAGHSLVPALACGSPHPESSFRTPQQVCAQVPALPSYSGPGCFCRGGTAPAPGLPLCQERRNSRFTEATFIPGLYHRQLSTSLTENVSYGYCFNIKVTFAATHPGVNRCSGNECPRSSRGPAPRLPCPFCPRGPE